MFCLFFSTPYPYSNRIEPNRTEPNRIERLHKAVDVWGVSERLGAYLRTKRAAKGRPETSAVAWGSVSRAVDGVGGVDDGGSGGTVASRKGKTAAGSSFLDERRREEADRIRGNLERASKPALWKRVRTNMLYTIYILLLFFGGGGRRILFGKQE